MKFLRTIFVLIGISAALAGAKPCNAQCEPDPFKWSMLPHCPTIADQLAKAVEAAQNFNANVAQLNSEIGEARDKYWKRYPDKPGYEAAELLFYKKLMEKDLYYLMLTLPTGMNDRVTKMPNIMGMLNGSVKPEDIGKFPTNVDGGIRPYAFPLFANWVNALRRAEGREETKGDEGTFATPFIIASAYQDRSNWRKAYEDARNWAEFLSSGIDITKHVTPKAYLLHQMEADVSLVNAKSKPAEIPEPVGAAKELYEQFVKMFGEKEVLASASKVLYAPKNSMGGLTPRAEVSVGSYTRAPSPAPMLLFFTMVTNATPKNYAIALCMDQFNYPGIDVMVNFETRETWGKAYTCYEQLVVKYGEASVLSAAGKLRGAEKNSSGGLRADPQSGSMTWWFQKLLKDPKAAIPDTTVPKFHAGSYDAHWLGKMVEVRGTVTRVDLMKGQFPPWATIHFKEAKGDDLTVFTPNSDMWQEMFNDDFSGLTGRTIDVWGQIEQWKSGAGVRVINRDQLKVVDSSAMNFADSRPEWLTAPLPVVKLVDSPKYLSWKKFPVGTMVTYETRLLHEYQPGSNLYTRTKISVNTFELKSIDEKKAVVVVTGTVWHLGGNPQPTQSRELVYPARVSAEELPQEKPNENGDETIEISGKKYATRWNSIWRKHYTNETEPDPQTFNKTWTSEDVPSGVVLQHDQTHREIVGKDYRDISETILMPTPNVEPELGSWSAYKIEQGGSASSPVKQVSPPVNNLPTPGTANSPNPGAATRAANTRAKGTATAEDPAPSRTPSVAPGPPTERGRTDVQAAQPQTPALPSNASPQMQFAQHYSQVMGRAARARSGLAQWQRAHGGASATLPQDVSAAKARMEDQFQSVVNSMRAQDMASADKQLGDVESTLTVIEAFLGLSAPAR
jgi:hypothetical protein